LRAVNRLLAMNKTLRNVLITAGAVVATLFVLVLVLPFLVPMDAYRGRIENAATSATGRTLAIKGPLRLMLFPHLGLRAHSVTLANVPGGRATALAQVGDIAISVQVLPLLSGHIALDKIILEQPVIALEVDAAGNGNWQFARQKKAEGQSSVTLPSGAAFSGLEIRDGRITYDNARTGTHRAVDHVNAEVAITRVNLPATVKGDLTYGPQKIAFDARVATLKTLLGNGSTTVELSARSDLMQAGFKGLLKPEGGAEGVFRLDTSSFRALAAAFGEPLPGKGFNAVSLESHIVSAGKVTTLDPLRLTLDQQHMQGKLTLDQRGEIPIVDGAFAVDRFDINPYFASSAGGAGASGPSRPGWSRAPISFAMLKKVDGRLTLTMGALRLRGLHLGKSTLTLSQQGGTLAARLDPAVLYGGSGSAELDVDARGAVPVLRIALTVKGVSLRPFLDDALGIDSVEGIGQLNLAVAAQGANANAIMHTMSGRGAISASQGRFRRVDLGMVARSVQAVLGGGATGEGASTDFHAMGGSFVIAGGVLSNNDFRMSGPVVQMTGKGQINTGERTIRFRLVPAAGVAGMSIGIPFLVEGSWDHVHYAPDLNDILGGVMQNLETGAAPFKGLFGGGNQQNGEKKKNVGQTLKDIFGLH
jgi:AsmA protein